MRVGAASFLAITAFVLIGCSSTPEPVRNEVFTRELARALHRPSLFAVPAFALRAFTGGMGNALLLSSQKVIPAVLIRSGFRFEHPRLEPALAAGLD